MLANKSQIKYGNRSYQLTDEDILWAARMLDGESGTNTVDGAAVLWTMTQRFALGRWNTFTELIQAYSQPINPIWKRNGERCRPGGRYHGTEHCSEARLNRRDAISSKPWDRINPLIRTLVSQWGSGNLPNPVPRAVEFADPRVAAGFINRPENRGSVYVARLSNHFIATAQTKQWPANYVTMTGGKAFPMSILLLLGIGILSAIVFIR